MGMSLPHPTDSPHALRHTPACSCVIRLNRRAVETLPGRNEHSSGRAVNQVWLIIMKALSRVRCMAGGRTGGHVGCVGQIL
eukprot:366018-Chlamydomonas_euryale.AAC.4